MASHKHVPMTHVPTFQYVNFTVEQKSGQISISPKPTPLRGQFSDVITWTILNNLSGSIQVELKGLNTAIASFNSAGNRTTPWFGPGNSAALSGSITVKPKNSTHYPYSVWVTYNGQQLNVDPDLQVDPPSSFHGAVRRRPKTRHGGKNGKHKVAKNKKPKP